MTERPKTTQYHRALESIQSNQTFDQYLYTLGIGINDLKGRILDLGSGAGELFSKTAGHYYGLKVVSVNPQLVNRESRLEALRRYERNFFYPDIDGPFQGRSVAAIAQELSFANNSFKTIVSAAAIPAYTHPNEYSTVISEMTRVLVDDGTIYLGPVEEENRAEFEKTLAAYSLHYNFKKVPWFDEKAQYQVRIVK